MIDIDGELPRDFGSWVLDMSWIRGMCFCGCSICGGAGGGQPGPTPQHPPPPPPPPPPDGGAHRKLAFF
jgi:hypothetical protein